ncbi:ROK family protein [Agromyces sp. SYSU T00194]|uniref:ROK family protein n=1 Tax=Agromyces chitinivorans TaxID=3158560 RepID=UPI00339A045C
MRPLALAVDIGGTKVESALVDDTGALVPGSRHRRPTGPTATSDELAAHVAQAVTATAAGLPDDGALVGCGIGAAGPVDLVDGLVSPLNLPVWRGFPLVDLVERALPGVPVTLRIDGLCITLAEHWVGAGRGVGAMMGMVVSTGIGGGFILDGRAVASPTGNGGHVGHIEVGGFDDACPCGGTGCVEAVASGPRTVAWARAQGFAGATGEELAAAHAVGDAVAIAAVRRAGTAVGRAIASATSLLDLDLVAIGGGFSHVAPEFFDHARAALAERTGFGFVTRLEIVPSALSGDGPLIGAAALVHRPHDLA